MNDFIVEILTEHDIYLAVSRIRSLIRDIYSEADQQAVYVTVLELGRNLINYASKGTIFCELRGETLCLLVRDQGKGIANLKDILDGRYSSTTGLGLGLLSAKRLMDEFYIETSERGTHITVIKRPANISIDTLQRRTQRMKLDFTEGCTIREFFLENQQQFEEQLLDHAVNVRDKIDEIKSIGQINLISNAKRFVLFLIEEREHDMINFAKEEGEKWARYSLTLSFKLEWVHAIRRVTWDFLFHYDQLNGTESDLVQFYEQEKRINQLFDLFLNNFFTHFSNYKDDLIRSHREMVEDLSVPIIPLMKSISVLSVIGTVDTFRGNMIVDKVISQIGSNQIKTLIIDLSGVALMDTGVIHHLVKVVDGIRLMGCKAVITGIRPEIVKTLIKLDISLSDKVETKATLQQALNDYLNVKNI